MTLVVTDSQVAQLRRMIAEPLTTTYSNEVLKEYISKYPIPDINRLRYDEDAWIPTYDLHASAADLWEEKAASVANQVSFSADGGNFQGDQRYQHCVTQGQYHSARRRSKNIEILDILDEDEDGVIN